MDTLSFQAPNEVKQRLEEVAKAFDRPKSYIIRQALEAHLQDLEDYMVAKQYKEHYDPKENISLDAIKEKFGLT